MRVVVVGDAMVDVIVRPDRSLIHGGDVSGHISERLGGGALTIASLLARQGVPTTFLGTVGRDDAGSHIIESLQRNGVSPRIGRSELAPTGRVLVIVDHSGQRTMVSDAGANAHPSDEVFRDWQQFFETTDIQCHAHVSAYWLTRPRTQARTLDVMHQLARSRHTLSLGMVPSSVWYPEYTDVLAQAVQLCNLVFANEEEAERASTTGIMGETPWVVTYGARGAAIWPDPPVPPEQLHEEIQDTTGAGDAFVAGVLASWTTAGADLSLAVLDGNIVAQEYLRDRVAHPLQ